MNKPTSHLYRLNSGQKYLQIKHVIEEWNVSVCVCICVLPLTLLFLHLPFLYSLTTDPHTHHCP